MGFEQSKEAAPPPAAHHGASQSTAGQGAPRQPGSPSASSSNPFLPQAQSQSHAHAKTEAHVPPEEAAPPGGHPTGTAAGARPPQPPGSPVTHAGQAPSAHGIMTRDSSAEGYVDPVRVLAAVQPAQLSELRQMNVKDLSRFLASLGLREMPDLVQKHGINGSVLHTLTAKDVDKMGFSSLGEAKALENLANILQEEERKNRREMVQLDKPVMFWGNAVEWVPGPCSALNRCSMKNYRSNCDQCCDSICCSPKEFAALPESRLRVYHDHLELTYPKWKDHVEDKYRKLDHAFVATNEPPFKVVVDNIDFSNIVDVDVEVIQKKDMYKRSCADCTNVLLCKKLRRQPNKGDFYWEGPCQSLCGYDLIYKQRPEGQVVVTLRSEDEGGDKRVIGLLEGTDEVAKAIMHHMEEAQLNREIRLH